MAEDKKMSQPKMPYPTQPPSYMPDHHRQDMMQCPQYNSKEMYHYIEKAYYYNKKAYKYMKKMMECCKKPSHHESSCGC